MKTFASLFTGFGLADIGAMQAGLEPIWGVENDPAIADVAKSNLKHDIRVQSVLDCNPHHFEKSDVLWASPPCTSFSVAKTNGKETDLDRQLAIKIVDFLKVLKPQSFILENVEAYKRSASLEFIEGALYGLGYWIDRQVLNAADFGVPQTRKRMILRAVLGGMPQSLPAPSRRIGWYEAIADLIPTLPESQFADWQLKRMPADLIQNCLVDGQNARTPEKGGLNYRESNDPTFTISAHGSLRKAFLLNRSQTERDDYFRQADRPSYTICAAGSCGRSRAFIVDGKNIHPDGSITIRQSDEPTFSVVSSTFDRPCHAPKSWLEHGKVVSMTSRALARFQTLPDWYALPDKNTLACKGIGNGVPCNFSEAIARSVC